MRSRLAPVLSAADLPLAELCAARLDGELFAVCGRFSPVDEPDDVRHRASILASLAPRRLVAELRSAGWVWGACAFPPHPQRFCVGSGARISIGAATPHRLREVVIDEADILEIEGLRLTTPLRTAIDLARSGAAFEEADFAVLQALMRLGGFGHEECLAVMDSRRNLPGKKAAIARILQAESAPRQPSLTR